MNRQKNKSATRTDRLHKHKTNQNLKVSHVYYNPKDVILSTLIAANGKGVKRDYLSRKAKVSDRQLRNYIAQLRDEGYIIGQPDGGGYSFNNLNDIHRAIIKEKARVRTLNKRIKKMERAIVLQDQLYMDV